MDEASVIPVLLKRKKCLQTNHFQQHVRPATLRKAIEYLRTTYPYYKELKFDYEKIQTLTVQFVGDDEEENEEMERIIDLDERQKNDNDQNSNSEEETDPEEDEKQ